MARMDSPYIVRYYDSFISNQSRVNIAMEYCDQGDLHKFLKKWKDQTDESKNNYLTENSIWKFFI